MTPDYLITLFKWALNASFWMAVGFIATTWTVWPWWKSSWGINIISLEGAISLALLPGILGYDFGVRFSQTAAGWVDVLSLGLVAFIIGWRGYLVVAAQLRGIRRTRRGPEPEPEPVPEDDPVPGEGCQA